MKTCQWGIAAVSIVLFSQLISFWTLSDFLIDFLLLNDEKYTTSASSIVVAVLGNTTNNNDTNRNLLFHNESSSLQERTKENEQQQNSVVASSSSSSLPKSRVTWPSPKPKPKQPKGSGTPKAQHLKQQSPKQPKQQQQPNKNKKNNNNNNNNKVLYPGLRLCRFPTLPRRRHDPIQITSEMVIGYQCAGPKYEKCSAKARALAWNHPNRSTTWAKDGIPIVRKQNSSILFIGNSHLSQIYNALTCQYQNDVIQFAWDKIQFQTNNISIYRSINEAWPYDKNSRSNLTHIFLQRFQRLPNSFDAIILGDFNGAEINYNFSLAQTRSEKFYTDVIEFGMKKNFTLQGVLTLNDLVNQFDGPIIRITSWYDTRPVNTNNDPNWNNTNPKKFAAIQKEAQQIPNRTNIVVLEGGQYIQDIGHCSHKFHHTKVVDAGYLDGTHRCLGGKGGHPDLLAYDVVDALSHLLPAT